MRNRKPLQVLLRPTERARLDSLAAAEQIPRGEFIRGLIDAEYQRRFAAGSPVPASISEAPIP